MKKLLLIYPPFATPLSPPYSLSKIFSFLKENKSKDIEIDVLDLNIRFHRQMFPEIYSYFRELKKNNMDWGEYGKKVLEYSKISQACYADNNKKVIQRNAPDLGKELLAKILEKRPDYAAFSLVFSSQSFYTSYLIDELKNSNINTIIGGPAVNSKIMEVSDITLSNELELLEYVAEKKYDHKKLKFEDPIDFAIFEQDKYFAPKSVIPLRTANACYYQRCAFCTHHQFSHYYEFPLDNIEKTIAYNKSKYVFFVDDLMHKKRLLDIAKITKKLGVEWMCQLRPDPNDLDRDTLQTLHDSGLKFIMWGVESGSDRILKLMDKGTNTNDIEKVLKDSHDAGIKNIVFIMFGFPTETKEEFLTTKEFLLNNSDNIDLVSTSIFGLQKNSRIYLDPKKYGITKIIETKRKHLDNKITYEVSSGLSQHEATEFFRNHKRSLEKINKYPKQLNFFREHMLILG
ncbi:MAG: radical SAM protein [Nanoarchaeota archaeon]|nr:radical SAM protein [Nanoarchaeota archaeon]